MDWLTFAVQFASLIAVVLAVIGLFQNNKVNNQQTNSLIFIEYTKRYEEIMSSFPVEAFFTRLDLDEAIPEASTEISLASLKYLNLCSEEYYLWKRKYLSHEIWCIWESELKRTLQSPLFRREWRLLKKEFESYPEFFEYVEKIQSEIHKHVV